MDGQTGLLENMEENIKTMAEAASSGRLTQLLNEMLPGAMRFLLNIIFALILLFVGKKLITFILKFLKLLKKQRWMPACKGF